MTFGRVLRASDEWVRCPRGPSGVELLEAAFDRHVFDRHMHDTYAIGVTDRGVQRFLCRRETHDSLPGNVIAINPGEVHDGRSGASGGYAYRMFYVSVASFRNIVEDALQRPVGRLDIQASRLVDPTLARLLNATWRAMTSSAESLASEELLHRSLIHLATRHADQPCVTQAAAHRERLRHVRDYLHDHPGPVSVAELAAVASINRFQLTRQFQHEFGRPLHAYHMQVRLEEARRRLRLGMAIADVAFALGFADQSHFHRRFKASFGVSPGAWQKAGSMTVECRK
jgi:AraC-like DNA-binding protein